MVVLAGMLVSACNLEAPETSSRMPLTAIDEMGLAERPYLEPSAPQDSVVIDIQTALESRRQDYESVIRDARARGTAGGALQGGLLGLLMTGTPEGAIAGSLAGGLIGYGVSGQAATQIVEEHRNFLIRKWSLEAVLDAARTDTEDTRFDLLLSERALKAISTGQVDPAVVEQSVELLSEFEERAETRAVALREVISLFTEKPVAVDQLSAELREQVGMLSDFRSNINQVVNSNE